MTKNRKLNIEWDIRAVQTYYNTNGNWYHALTRFPAAYIDNNGYVKWETEAEYRSDHSESHYTENRFQLR